MVRNDGVCFVMDFYIFFYYYIERSQCDIALQETLFMVSTS